MSAVPLANSRVSFQQSSSLLLGTLQSDQASLLQVQQQISTGNRLSLGSDDPAATIGIQSLNRQIADNTQYTSNLNFASSFLGTADSSLSTLSNLITSASSVASSQANTGSTAAERAAQAQVIDSYLNQALDLANTQYQGQAVFGGANGVANPFVASGNGYKYVGSAQTQGILTPSGSQIQYSTDGNDVFGGLASEVTGTPTLTPALTSTTRLADLGGAKASGIATGPINLTVGGTTVSVDLSQAATAGDVVNLLNSALTTAGSDASVSLSGGSLVVNGDSTQSITISDVQSGNTAADLGIAGTIAPTTTFTGTPLSPQITTTTPLSALNNGTPLDPAGFVITNGSASATIKLTGLNNVGDLLNAINNSGINVEASINSTGNGINILNPLSGTSLTIGENGGDTATQLGIRSFNTSTSLSSLNNGAGVTPVSTSPTASFPTGNITITKTDGSAFSVSMNGITSQAQLIAAINSAAGNGSVTAASDASDNGITLTDTSGGSGNVSIGPGSDYVSNGSSFSALQTGAGNTLTTAPLTLSTDDFRITRKDGTSFTVNVTGDSTIQDVLNSINSAAGNTNPANQVTASLNTNGNGIELNDASTGTGDLSVSALNNSTAAAQLGILKSAPAASSSTINGDDTNPLQSTGLFSTLTMLRNALLNNDTAAITQAGELLTQNATQVENVQGVVAARAQDVTNRTGEASDQMTQLQTSLAALSGTDITSAITQYQNLETAYEAALKVSSTATNESLLDFLN